MFESCRAHQKIGETCKIVVLCRLPSPRVSLDSLVYRYREGASADAWSKATHP